MRHELIIQNDGEFVDLRGIFTDLLTVSKKDSGFIRANENTPYPLEQLAGMFCVPVERLSQCIDICLRPEVHKLRKHSNGVLFVISHADYDLSDSYKYRLENENEESIEHGEQGSKNSDPIQYKIRQDKIRGDKRERVSPLPLETVSWNLFASQNNLSLVREMSPSRNRHLLLRRGESAFEFEKILEALKKARFALGENDRGWKVDFDFVIHSKDNYLKILEGKYSGSTNTGKNRNGSGGVIAEKGKYAGVASAGRPDKRT